MSRLVTTGEPLAVITAASTGPVRAGDHFRGGLGGAECNVAVAVLDPVGAGEAFTAGYVTEMMREQPANVRLATAMALGRWSVTTHGDHHGLPYADGLVAWTDDNALR